jgi:hypothetical protein
VYEGFRGFRGFSCVQHVFIDGTATRAAPASGHLLPHLACCPPQSRVPGRRTVVGSGHGGHSLCLCHHRYRAQQRGQWGAEAANRGCRAGGCAAQGPDAVLRLVAHLQGVWAHTSRVPSSGPKWAGPPVKCAPAAPAACGAHHVEELQQGGGVAALAAVFVEGPAAKWCVRVHGCFISCTGAGHGRVHSASPDLYRFFSTPSCTTPMLTQCSP